MKENPALPKLTTMDVAKYMKLWFDTLHYCVQEFHTPSIFASTDHVTIACTDGKYVQEKCSCCSFIDCVGLWGLILGTESGD